MHTMKALKLVTAATLSAILLAPCASVASSKHAGHNQGNVRTEGKVSKETKKKVKRANSGKKVKNLTVKKGETVVFN